MIDGAFCRAVSKRPRTRAAPTPTNISMKCDPVTEMKGTPASPATARAIKRLARARRPDEQHALGDAGADLLELRRVAEELDHLADVGLDGVVAGDVVERRRRAFGGVHVPGVAAEGRRSAHGRPSSSG